MRESVIEKRLTKGVEELGGEVRKVEWIGRRGAPDRVIFFCGAVVFIELKAPDGKLKPHQAREHARMRKQGAVVEVAYTTQQVDQLLEALRHLPAAVRAKAYAVAAYNQIVELQKGSKVDVVH